MHISCIISFIIRKIHQKSIYIILLNISDLFMIWKNISQMDLMQFLWRSQLISRKKHFSNVMILTNIPLSQNVPYEHIMFDKWPCYMGNVFHTRKYEALSVRYWAYVHDNEPCDYYTEPINISNDMLWKLWSNYLVNLSKSLCFHGNSISTIKAVCFISEIKTKEQEGILMLLKVKTGKSGLWEVVERSCYFTHDRSILTFSPTKSNSSTQCIQTHYKMKYKRLHVIVHSIIQFQWYGN